MTSARVRRHSREVVDVDLYDPQLWASRGQPADVFAALRDRAPVAWVDEPPVLGWPEGPGYWGDFPHADVRAVNTHPHVFSSQLGATQIRDRPAAVRPVTPPAGVVGPHLGAPQTPDAVPDDLAFEGRRLLSLDPPEHALLRRTLNRAFTPRAVARMSEWVHARAAAIVGALEG